MTIASTSRRTSRRDRWYGGVRRSRDRFGLRRRNRARCDPNPQRQHRRPEGRAAVQHARQGLPVLLRPQAGQPGRTGFDQAELGLAERHPERLRPVQPAVGLRAALRHGRCRPDRRRSSTPRTTRTPSPTSRPTAPSTACPPAPRPTAASRRSTRTARPSPLPTADTGWAGEISLDLDMVSAVCPNCHILLVEATTPTTANLGTAVNTRGHAWAPSSSPTATAAPRTAARTPTTPATSTTRAWPSPPAPVTATTTAAPTRPRRSTSPRSVAPR